jgi:hypothetical protein
VRKRFSDRTRRLSTNTGDDNTALSAAKTDNAGTAIEATTGTDGLTTTGAATTGVAVTCTEATGTATDGTASCTCAEAIRATGTAKATPVATGQAEAAATSKPHNKTTLNPTQLHKRFIAEPPLRTEHNYRLNDASKANSLPDQLLQQFAGFIRR